MVLKQKQTKRPLAKHPKVKPLFLIFQRRYVFLCSATVGLVTNTKTLEISREFLEKYFKRLLKNLPQKHTNKKNIGETFQLKPEQELSQKATA